MRNLLGLLTAALVLVPSPLGAQENRAWPERAFVTIDVPFQPLNNDFSESLSFADTLRKNENVTFVAGYDTTRGPAIDVGAGVRLGNRFGAGVTTSWFRRSGSGSFDLKLPNPLVANKPLDLTDTVSGLKRQELGIHVQALYAVSLGKKARVLAAGGPSVFQVTQDLVRSVEFDTLPGFTSLNFNQALIAQVRKTAVGFNVGADITWTLASHFGVGTVTRYSRASLTLDPGAASGVIRAIEMHAGGLHIGGGIRVLF